MRFALVLLAACTPVAAAPASGPVVEIAGDLDGKPGDEKIVLFGDGTLAVGKAKIKLVFDRPEGATTDSQLAVVSLGGKRRGVHLISPTEDVEDPPPRHRVFLYDKGTLRLVHDDVVGSTVKFSKLGTARYVESGWAACMREQDANPNVTPTRARKQIITLKLDAAGKRMVKTIKPSTEFQDCDQLAACPFVYEVVGDDVRFVGEILRNLRDKSLETTQTLWLGERAGPATVRLVEQKPETTYLDEVYLDVDGVRVAPRACAVVPSLPYCSADGNYHLMAIGDVLELEFDTPGGKRELVARGYYIPTIAAN